VERKKKIVTNKQLQAHRNAKWKEEEDVFQPPSPDAFGKCPVICTVRCRCSLELGDSHDIQKGAAVYADEV
jgi:hypothetical protein